MVKNITNDYFNETIVKEEQPVLLDFYGTWCGPCKMFAPILEQVDSEVKNSKIYTVDIDKEPMLVEKFNIRSVPTLVVLNKGNVVEMATGVRSKEDVLRMLQEV